MAAFISAGSYITHVRNRRKPITLVNTFCQMSSAQGSSEVLRLLKQDATSKRARTRKQRQINTKAQIALQPKPSTSPRNVDPQLKPASLLQSYNKAPSRISSATKCTAVSPPGHCHPELYLQLQSSSPDRRGRTLVYSCSRTRNYMRRSELCLQRSRSHNGPRDRKRITFLSKPQARRWEEGVVPVENQQRLGLVLVTLCSTTDFPIFPNTTQIETRRAYGPN